MSTEPAAAPAEAKKGHNKPPVEVPDEARLIEDLGEAYPTAQSTLEEMQAAAKDVPAVIKDDDTYAKVSVLLKKAADNRNDWEAIGVKRARPWKAAGNIIRGWFKIKEDACDALIKDLKPRHIAYSEDKAAREQAEAEERAEKARALAAEKKFDADWAEALVELAEWNAANSRRLADEARAREDYERETQLMAEAFEELAAFDARAAEARKKALEEKAAGERKDRKNELRRLTAEAKRLGLLDKAEGLTDASLLRYRELIGPNGLIPKLKELLQDDRNLLSDEDRLELDEETAELERLQLERVANREAAEAARGRAMGALQESNDHEAVARAAEKAAPALERKAVQTGREASKLDNRATRTEMAAETLTVADASRVRGHGTAGTLTGSWQPRIDDYDAIPVEMLKEDIHRDAVEAAITKFKARKQAEWVELRGTAPGLGYVTDALPGVTFVWTPDTRVSG